MKAVHNIGFLSENKIALYRKFEDLRIVVVDRIEDKILYKSHKVPKCLATSSSGRTFPFFYADNQLKLHEGFSNQIYIITEKKIVRDKFLDFGDKNIDLKKMPNSQNDQVKYRGWIREENHPKYIFPFKSNLEHGRYSLISYGANKDLRYLILDKNSDKYITFSGYEENIMFPHYGVTTWEKGYNVIVHPLILDWYVNSSVLDDKNLKVLRSVKKDDNPVVLKYYLNPSFTIK